MIERGIPIGGGWESPGLERIEISSPFDGRLLSSVPRCDPSDVERAASFAANALDTSPLPPWKRAEILDRASELLEQGTDVLAPIIAAEAAKPIREARVEVHRAASTFRFAAVEARSQAGEVVPLDASEVGAGKLAFTLKMPVGVIAAITPFNFPLNLVAHKVAPALAAGCPVILKPASQTPSPAIALAELLLRECGLPPEYLQILTGPGSTLGSALADHPAVAAVTFTGSPDVGWSLRERAPRKHVYLELGNNAPVILAPDCDWRAAAAKIAVAGYSHAGQSCISTQRVFVHEAIAKPFLEALVPAVQALVTGDPLDERTDVSAVISPGERDRVKAWIDEAIAGGARLATGGRVRDSVVEPTVLTDVEPSMRVCAEEIFGPVVAVQCYGQIDDAFRLANDTRYGLQASVFTRDLHLALRAARVLRFGGVLINEVPTFRADQMPYGGLRDSGNTREGPRYAIRAMTESRLVVLDA